MPKEERLNQEISSLTETHDRLDQKLAALRKDWATEIHRDRKLQLAAQIEEATKDRNKVARKLEALGA
jgi:prefoldin subunit 5